MTLEELRDMREDAGHAITSAIDEYCPPEFFTVLDELEKRLAAEAALPDPREAAPNPTFRNFRLMHDVPAGELPKTYFLGCDTEPFDGTVVGKLRPWDEGCKEYVLYADGDLMIAEIVK